jgi:hypothetical protein
MTTPPKTIRETSVDAQALAKVLEAAQPGEVVPYATLSAVIRKDVQRAGYSTMDSARRLLIRDKGMVFEAVLNVGLKRLEGSGIVALGPDANGRIRRTAGRAIKKMACIGTAYDSLSTDEKSSYNSNISALGAVKLFTGAPSIKRIESQVRASSAQLPPAEVLGLFAK